jgi:hypothetical protein
MVLYPKSLKKNSKWQPYIMLSYSPLLNASIGIINDADSPLPFAIYAISIVLGKILLGLAILKIIQGLWQFFLLKIKRAIAFFKQKIAQMDAEGVRG